MAIAAGSMTYSVSALYPHCGMRVESYQNPHDWTTTIVCKCGEVATVDSLGRFTGWPAKVKNVTEAAEPQEDALQYFINNL